MKIAQVAPLTESVPPKFYGGTERVVSYLTEELVQQGHEVTLYASGDSVTTARLRTVCRQSIRLDPKASDPLPHLILMIEKVLREAEDFDVVHFHIDYLHFPIFRRQGAPTVTTMHGRLDLPDLEPLFREFCDMPMVSISHAQRVPMPWLNWQATIAHGLPADLLRLQPQPGKYLAFIGRICPEKRPDLAVRIARESGMELKVAAKIDAVDRDYYNEVIRPLFAEPHVDFVGEVNDAEKNAFLGGAHALLFPINWPEPFGLVMIEAMACGTPTIAFPAGSVPEIIDDGRTGFVVRNVPEAVEAVSKVDDLCRHQIRQVFDRRFTTKRMARNYVKVYNQLTRRLRPVAEMA